MYHIQTLFQDSKVSVTSVAPTSQVRSSAIFCSCLWGIIMYGVYSIFPENHSGGLKVETHTRLSDLINLVSSFLERKYAE
jgi:hypothetical protein